jgi:hypothetical protein
MWQRYLERVDPVLKITHAPTVQRNILNITRDKSRFDLDFPHHTLLFSIYYTSVITMSGEECREEFQESRRQTLKR